MIIDEQSHKSTRLPLLNQNSQILVQKTHHPNILSHQYTSFQTPQQLSILFQTETFSFEIIGANFGDTPNGTTAHPQAAETIRYDPSPNEKFIDCITVPVASLGNKIEQCQLLLALQQDQSSSKLRVLLFSPLLTCATTSAIQVLEISLPSSLFVPIDFSCVVLSSPAISHSSTRKTLIAICSKRKQDRIIILQVDEGGTKVRQVGLIEPDQCEKKGVNACSSLYRNELCVMWNSGHVSFYRLYGNDVHGNIMIDCLSMNQCLFGFINQQKIVSLDPIVSDNQKTPPKWIMVRQSNSTSVLANHLHTKHNDGLGVSLLSAVESNGIFEPGTLTFSELNAQQQFAESGCYISVVGRKDSSNIVFQSNEIRCSVIDPDFAMVLPRKWPSTTTSEDTFNFDVVVANHSVSSICLVPLHYSFEGSLKMEHEEETVTVQSTIEDEKRKIIGLSCPEHPPSLKRKHQLLVLTGAKYVNQKNASAFFFAPLHTGFKYSDLVLHSFSLISPTELQQGAATRPLDNIDSLYSLLSDLHNTVTTRFDRMDQMMSHLSDRVLKIENHLINTNH